MEKLTIDDFDILEPIGTGSFSNVYHAIHKTSGKHFALKKLFWNNAPDRILKEVRFIHALDDSNIVKVYALFRDADQVTMVLEHIPHKPFRVLMPHLKGDYIKDYMHGLLSALAYLHKNKIIHRDVKPANFLFDTDTRIGKLIDFGLCEEDLHLDAQENQETETIFDINPQNDFDLTNPQNCQNRPKMIANRAGTRGFRAPEVLFYYWNQSPLIDIWSAGVVLLSILSQRYPFFKSPDDLTAICELATITGTARLHEAARECGRKLRFPQEIVAPSLKEIIYKLNSYIDEFDVDPNAYDLLERMLEPCPNKRISAEDALAHPFFKRNNEQ